jgi:HAD superfamily hydrolase (TIGR01509 family)
VSIELPEAVVFDCDGTIADTERLSDIAWREALQRRGYPADASDFAALVGRPFLRNWEYFSARAELGDMDEFRTDIRTRFRELFDADLELHDDAVDVIRELARRGVAIAVASSSSRDHVERVLDRAGIVREVSALVGSEDVSDHKPLPAPYLEACLRLGAAPLRSSAVEDTPVGATSARAAGLFTVVVRRAHAAPDLESHADRIVDVLTLSDVVRTPLGED